MMHSNIETSTCKHAAKHLGSHPGRVVLACLKNTAAYEVRLAGWWCSVHACRKRRVYACKSHGALVCFLWQGVHAGIGRNYVPRLYRFDTSCLTGSQRHRAHSAPTALGARLRQRSGARLLRRTGRALQLQPMVAPDQAPRRASPHPRQRRGAPARAKVGAAWRARAPGLS